MCAAIIVRATFSLCNCKFFAINNDYFLTVPVEIERLKELHTDGKMDLNINWEDIRSNDISEVNSSARYEL